MSGERCFASTLPKVGGSGYRQVEDPLDFDNTIPFGCEKEFLLREDASNHLFFYPSLCIHGTAVLIAHQRIVRF